MASPSPLGIKDAVQALAVAQRAEGGLPEGFDGGAVSKAVMAATASGELDAASFANLASQGLAIAGGAACAGAGLVALAPVCSAAGKIVGDLIGGLFADPPPPPPGPDPGAIWLAEQQADQAWILSRRAATLAEVLAKVSSDKTASAQLQAAIDALLPGFPLDTYRNPEGYAPPFDDQPWGGGWGLPLWPWPFVFGSLSGWAKQLDFSSLDGITTYYDAIRAKLKTQGVDFGPQYAQLEAAAKAGNYPQQSPEWRRLNVYRDVKRYLWPVLEVELQLRLKAIFTGAAVKAKLAMASALEALAAQLRAGGVPAGEAQQIAQQCAELLATATPDQVYQQITEGLELHDQAGDKKPGGGEGWGAGRWALAGLTLAGAGVGAVAAVRVAQGKPALPPAVRAGASRAAGAVRGAVARLRR